MGTHMDSAERACAGELEIWINRSLATDHNRLTNFYDLAFLSQGRNVGEEITVPPKNYKVAHLQSSWYMR
jgi:hypothetical protein